MLFIELIGSLDCVIDLPIINIFEPLLIAWPGEFILFWSFAFFLESLIPGVTNSIFVLFKCLFKLGIS